MDVSHIAWIALGLFVVVVATLVVLHRRRVARRARAAAGFLSWLKRFEK